MKTLHLMSAVLAAAVVALAGSAQAEMKKEWVEYSHDGMKLKGYLAYDDKITGKRPAILLIHDRAGMSPIRSGIPRPGPSSAMSRSRPTSSATAKASCPRTCRRRRRRWASTPRTAH